MDNKNLNYEVKILVRKLLSGKINSEELQKLNDWYDSFNSINQIEIFNGETDINDDVKSKLLSFINSKRKKTFPLYSVFNQYKNIAAAITISILAIISIAIIFNINSQSKKITWNEIHVRNGQKKIVTLSDFSKITLNSGSYLKYPKQFDLNLREVFLEGEGYFEITPNKNRKFIVHTSKMTTTVLGTKFNISAFKNDERNTVSLVEGKVEVEKVLKFGKKNKTILKPLEQFIISSNESEVKIKSFDLKEEIGWKDNILIFNRKPFKQILKVLSRNYGVKFIITNEKYAKRKITANFNDATLSTVIRSIEKLTNLKSYVEKDDERQMIVFY